MDEIRFKKGDRIGVSVTFGSIEAANRNTRRTAHWNREKKVWEVTVASKDGVCAITVDVPATPQEESGETT